MKSCVTVPQDGGTIERDAGGRLQCPDFPVIPFIRGDGVGADITPVTQKVVNAAVQAAYAGRRALKWMEIYAGGRSTEVYGEGVWLPDETMEYIRRFRVALKGPLTTPVGGGIRSLNVAIRQGLDLYICLRPVRYFQGVPSPVKHPERTDMVIFRENAEDIYAGIEWQAGSAEADRVIAYLQDTMGVKKIRFPENCGVGVKVMSRQGSERLIRAAIEYAFVHGRRSVTLVHKGNIMKYTEGAFRQWGYDLAQQEFGGVRGADGVMRMHRDGRVVIIKDCIADAFLQNALIKPQDYDVIAAMNLNGDYISDALAAQVGGIGIAPGANIGDDCAVFEATHGTAPDIAGTGRANPGSLILSAAMLLEHIGWDEAAMALTQALEKTLARGLVTHDFAAQIPNARALDTADFGEEIIRSLDLLA